MLLLLNPVTAAPGPSGQRSPPYLRATSVATNTTGVGSYCSAILPTHRTGAPVPAAAYRSNGSARFSLCATGLLARSGGVLQSVNATAGFSLPLTVAVTGSYSLSANWLLRWNATSGGSLCNGFAMCGGCPSIDLSVTLKVLDTTNRTSISVKPVVILSGCRSAGANNSSTIAVIQWNGTLNSGHSYRFVSTVVGRLTSRTFCASPNGCGSRAASLDFATNGHGGVLNWVRIR